MTDQPSSESQNRLAFDDVRRRIAKALYRQLFWVTTPLEDQTEEIRNAWLFDADIVIRELGLQPQAHYDPDCDHYRYVTDWIDPQAVPQTAEQRNFPNTLRSRIAAIIDREVDGLWEPLDVADAVIRELGLHRNDEEDEFGGWKPTGRHRYVTEWETTNDGN